MKKTIISWLQIIVLFSLIDSCKEDEYVSPGKGKISFSPSKVIVTNGRIGEIARAAFLLLTIKDHYGKADKNIKLPLFTFGQGYVSENLELETGHYQLTEFVVLDSAYQAIYASPVEGSEMAKYVTDPLSIEFIISNEGSQVTPQVLAVDRKDDPNLFGYASFGFDVVTVVPRLNIQLQFPDAVNYDSAYILFKNSDTLIKQKMILDNATYKASGVIANLSSGKWEVSASFFRTIATNYKSLEKNGVINLDITGTATDLITNEISALIKDGTDPIEKYIRWEEYYYYQLYLRSGDATTLEGFVRFPKDPTNPFIEISTFTPKWIYGYTDRSFYNSSHDGTSNYYQGGGAFEIYGKYGDTYDRLAGDIIDTTSLIPGISEVTNKVWNKVDGVVIIQGADANQELLLYHVWDLSQSNGRIKAYSHTERWTKSEVDKGNGIHLHPQR